MNNSRVPKIDMPQIDTCYNFCLISIFRRFFVDFYAKITMSKVDTFFEFCAQLQWVNLWQRTVFCWQFNFYFEILSIFFFHFQILRIAESGFICHGSGSSALNWCFPHVGRPLGTILSGRLVKGSFICSKSIIPSILCIALWQCNGHHPGLSALNLVIAYPEIRKMGRWNWNNYKTTENFSDLSGSHRPILRQLVFFHLEPLKTH